jgi:hypothetical protein
MIRAVLVIVVGALLFAEGARAGESGKRFSASRCLSDFLSNDGDWQARTFDGVTIDGDAFTPVRALFVRNGHVHAKVWNSEPTSARIKSEGSDIVLNLFYPEMLLPAGNAKSNRLQPYVAARHQLVIHGECQSPESLTIEIETEAGRTRTVALDRVPTSRIEFQEPASWDWSR